MVFHLHTCLAASLAVPSPVPCGAGKHHNSVGLHSQHGTAQHSSITHWGTTPDLQRATGMHMDRRGQLEERKMGGGGSLLVLRVLIPVLEEVLGGDAKICMFLASLRTCAILSLFSGT